MLMYHYATIFEYLKAAGIIREFWTLNHIMIILMQLEQGKNVPVYTFMGSWTDLILMVLVFLVKAFSKSFNELLENLNFQSCHIHLHLKQSNSLHNKLKYFNSEYLKHEPLAYHMNAELNLSASSGGSLRYGF